VKHTYRPHTGVLVAEGDLYWQLEAPEPGATTKPGLILYRFGAPLFYANSGRFAEEIRAIVSTPYPTKRWLVVDAEAITQLDYTAARVVRDLHEELIETDVILAFARVGPYLQADFDRHHITDVIGRNLIFPRLHDALQAFARQSQTAPQQTHP
jgi:MFS superfamily sulfate permease-like transporter